MKRKMKEEEEGWERWYGPAVRFGTWFRCIRRKTWRWGRHSVVCMCCVWRVWRSSWCTLNTFISVNDIIYYFSSATHIMYFSRMRINNEVVWMSAGVCVGVLHENVLTYSSVLLLYESSVLFEWNGKWWWEYSDVQCSTNAIYTSFVESIVPHAASHCKIRIIHIRLWIIMFRTERWQRICYSCDPIKLFSK